MISYWFVCLLRINDIKLSSMAVITNYEINKWEQVNHFLMKINK